MHTVQRASQRRNLLLSWGDVTQKAQKAFPFKPTPKLRFFIVLSLHTILTAAADSGVD